jgi:hypothetical protein
MHSRSRELSASQNSKSSASLHRLSQQSTRNFQDLPPKNEQCNDAIALFPSLPE